MTNLMQSNQVISLNRISEICGVSIGTVSKALSGKPGVRDTTRQRILSVAEQYRYRPNRLVHAIQKGRSMTVGLTCRNFGDEFGGRIMSGMMEVLFHAEYDPIVISWELSVTEGVRALRSLTERRVDGILMFPPAELPTAPYLEELRIFNGPIVVVDQVWPGCNYDFIGSQDVEGADAVTEHLIKLGHRKIAHIHLDGVSTGLSRLEGFQRAMIRHGIAIHEKWLPAIHHYGSDEPYKLARELLSESDRPTAIVAFNDFVAMQVLAAAHDLGLSVPQDLSVTGFGDLNATRHLRPALTTVAQNPLEIGRRAAQRLLDQIESNATAGSSLIPSNPVQERLPSSLVIRQSTGPVSR
jgi:DNA-binding LacI/PurR family transcriptional regulator